MKYINPVNTRRISVEMSELLIEEVETLCEIPAVYEQRTISALLRLVCKPVERPNAVSDPRMWSVNERMFVVASYMSATRDDGPDFLVGEAKEGERQARLSDYLLASTDYQSDIPFTFEGEELLFSPLLGYQAEIIESLIAGGVYKPTDFSWWCAAMAACVRGAGDEPLEYTDDASYETALVGRINNIRLMPESRFVGMFNAYIDATVAAAHLVHAVTSQYGVIASPVSEQPEGEPELATARFPAHSCISERARSIMGFL